MSIIALLGPHAVGKSTAADRWLVRYGSLGLVVVHCDNSRIVTATGSTTQKGWSGSTEEKQSLARVCAASPLIHVLEGNTARNIPWLKAVPVVAIIHATCNWEQFSVFMQSRCAAKGKKYREDYWDSKKLEYEAHQRLHNAVHNYGICSPIADFMIEDQTADWHRVDEHFSQLFRQLHNKNVRGHR